MHLFVDGNCDNNVCYVHAHVFCLASDACSVCPCTDHSAVTLLAASYWCRYVPDHLVSEARHCHAYSAIDSYAVYRSSIAVWRFVFL